MNQPVRAQPFGNAGPGAGPEAVSGLLYRGRVWAPVLKSAALFLLPFPLLFAVLAALFSDDPFRLGLTAGALGCIWGAGAISWRALVAEARYVLGDRADLPPFPSKLVSLVLTAIGAALAAVAGGHSLVGAAMFAVLGAAGYLAFYGVDMRPRRIAVTAVEGVDVNTVSQQLEQAYRRLRRIEAASRAIAVPEFGERLTRITGIGRGILAEIERDPREAARARRFLHLYLDSTERVTEEYARTHQQVRSQELDRNFRQLLVDMETSFAQQHEKLLQHDAMSLDVDIEVLSARLKRDEPGDKMETRS